MTTLGKYRQHADDFGLGNPDHARFKLLSKTENLPLFSNLLLSFGFQSSPLIWQPIKTRESTRGFYFMTSVLRHLLHVHFFYRRRI